MLAAERGAGEQHARRLPPRSRRSCRASARRGRQHRQGRRPTTCAAFSPLSPSAASSPSSRGAASVGDAPALSLPLRRRKTQRRSGRGAGRAQARPPAAEGAVDRRRRSRCSTRRARDGEMTRQPPAAAPARGAAAVPAGSRLRHRLARLRTGGAAGLGRAARPAHARGARQRRQGTAGAAQRGGQARDGGLSRSCAPKAGATAQSKWLFPSFGEQGHLTRQHFARELKALGRALRHRAGDGCQPACAAPCLRQPSAAQRRRSARGADAARPCRHLDHADLYPCAGRTAENAGARPASAGRRLTGHAVKPILTRLLDLNGLARVTSATSDQHIPPDTHAQLSRLRKAGGRTGGQGRGTARHGRERRRRRRRRRDQPARGQGRARAARNSMPS